VGGPLSVPTLYLHGQDDGCIGAELSEGMEPLFPAGLERVELPGCGHFLHQEKPEEVSRLLLDFLVSD
jgi:pimeloyl-ACP methyl ester carboxylesterase